MASVDAVAAQVADEGEQGRGAECRGDAEVSSRERPAVAELCAREPVGLSAIFSSAAAPPSKRRATRRASAARRRYSRGGGEGRMGAAEFGG